MLLKNCVINQKKFVEEYSKFIHNKLNKNHDDFMFSLKSSKIIDTTGNIDYKKVGFYGEKYSGELYDLIIKENIDANVFMQNAVLYYDLHEYMGLLAMVSAYYEMAHGRIPLHILQFAVDNELLRYFLQAFTNIYRYKSSYLTAK